MPIIMAGIVGIYGLVTAVIAVFASGSSDEPVRLFFNDLQRAVVSALHLR
jgi:hypothetical protein